jgi:hypothetical protein
VCDSCILKESNFEWYEIPTAVKLADISVKVV